MPFLDVQLSGVPDAPLAARVAAALTDLTAELLGKDPRLTAVSVRFVDAQHWFVARASLAEQGARSYHLTITITDETNTKAEKARYIAQAHDRLSALVGGAHEKSYVHLLDSRAAAYGYGGATQERRWVAAGLPR